MCHKEKKNVKGVARWFWSKETYNKDKSKVLVKKVGEDWKAYKRVYGGSGTPIQSILDKDKVGGTSNGKKEVEDLLGSGIFDNPKPTNLVTSFIERCPDDALVLDFFSGSATTAHSVMRINAEQNKSVKYILVQLSEVTNSDSKAYKSGYKNICEIGKERIRRAAKKIKEETAADIDYGFRVYRLDDSNMQDVYYRPQDYDQSKMDMFADNVKPDRNSDDLLTQVMLDWGLPLSLKIEQLRIANKQVFKVADNSLYACFESGVDEDFAKEIAKDKPLRVVFKDNSFKDNSAKTNVKQLLKQLSPETEMKVL